MSKSKTAKQAFNETAENIEAQIAKLQAHLAVHRARFEKTDQKSWAFAGDLGHISENLEELNAFMGSIQA